MALFNTTPEIKDIPATLYVVKLLDKKHNQIFGKVGITTRNVTLRFKTEPNVSVIEEKSISLSLIECFMLEQKFYSLLNHIKYFPIQTLVEEPSVLKSTILMMLLIFVAI